MSENSDSDAFNSSHVGLSSTQQPSLDSDPFYFETDCAALRTNPDYSCLVKTLVLLEAQRIQACQDLERLIDLREHVSDPATRPSEFVRQELPKLELPERQKVYCLPQIEWNRYFETGGGGLDSDALEAIRVQNMGFRSRRAQQQPGKYVVSGFIGGSRF